MRKPGDTLGTVAIIGAGLAGSEAALVLARNGISVDLFEARPERMTPAHKTGYPAELVCSNSFKSNQLPSAHGLLKAELSILGSPVLEAAKRCAIPGGSALVVDREAFSAEVERLIREEPGIRLIRQELKEPPLSYRCCIIAAGPLASEDLTNWLAETFSASSLHFYDAIAPIVSADSLDMSIVFSASRWEDGEGDYLNCPFSEEQYRVFYDTLREADRVIARSFENQKFFEACLPIEVAAQRGYEALAFGPLRPVGLIDPRTGKRPFAVCQLRREKLSGESYNLVGFQTRLTIPEQKRVFRLIPGMEKAEFLRFGSIHRNTYLDSPKLLCEDLSFHSNRSLFLAGQICGSEGYTESVVTGHLAAAAVVARVRGETFVVPPAETALGSLLRHVTCSEEKSFTPSNIHFGLFPPLEEKRKGRGWKKEKKELLCDRGVKGMIDWSLKTGLVRGSEAKQSQSVPA